MTIKIYTAETSGTVANMELSDTMPASLTGGMALDGVEMLSGAYLSVKTIGAGLFLQGFANNDSVMRGVVSSYLTGSSAMGAASASCSTSLVGLADADGSDLNVVVSSSYASGSGASASVPGCSYAYPVLAGFTFNLGQATKLMNIQCQTNVSTAGVSGGEIAWSPTTAMQVGSNLSFTGSSNFLVVGIKTGSAIPPAPTCKWASNKATASYTFTGLTTQIASAAVFIDGFYVTFGSTLREVLDIVLAAANQTVSIINTPTGPDTYDVKITWVPGLAMRGDGKTYSDLPNCYITFRVFAFPGTPLATNG